MKWLLRLALVLVCGIAQAQTLGYVISGVQLLTAKQVPVYYVKVESTGPDFNSARQNAFKLAVEHAVGTVVLSETEMRNSRIVRNEIINYSSGFVDKFNILEQEHVNGSVKLTVEVWVSSSAIANRLLNTSTSSGEVAGDRIAVQINSLQAQRHQTDQVVEAIMRDYPGRAFDIMLQPVKIQFDSNRQGYMHIPFMIRWNKKYLDSLEEMVQTVNQYPRCKIMSGVCTGAQASVVLKINAVSLDPGAWFNDEYTTDIMFKHMVGSRPVYRLVLTNTTGDQSVHCFRAAELDQTAGRSLYLATFNGNRVTIHGTELLRLSLGLSLEGLKTDTITGASVDVVRFSQCNPTK